jgi:hypothetical protein
MDTIKKTNTGPPTFERARFPVEQDLGTKDTPMKDPTVPPAPLPEFGTSRFGSNLVEKDPTSAFNPKGPVSPGVPTHQVGVRFGAENVLPDKTPAYNPEK